MRQLKRTRTKQVERVEQPAEEVVERDEHAEEVSDEAGCCLADIDAVIDEACCLIAEAEAEREPTAEEFDREYYRLQDIYLGTPDGSAEESAAYDALKAYRNRWPQYDDRCSC